MSDRPPTARRWRVRREVLGDEHVDRAVAGTTDVTARLPGLHHPLRLGRHLDPPRPRPPRALGRHADRARRRRHFDELEFHLRAALRNGLTREEIVEVLLQTAVYVGVPAANSAFAVAKRVLAE